MPRLLAVLLLAVAATGCAPSRIASAPESPVVPVRLSAPIYANAYLVLGRGGPVVVDPGSASESDARLLDAALAAHGFAPEDVVLAVATHAHADHAGGIARLQGMGVPVLAGAGDLHAFRAGHNDSLHAIGPEAAFVKALFIHEESFPAFEPDLVLDVDQVSLDLRPYGVDGTAVRMPGHTPGSLALLLDSGDAIAGDIVRGGYMGGRLARGTPLTHYFHDDRLRAHAASGALLRWGARRVYVGHGGPLTADRLHSWSERRPTHGGRSR